MTELLWLATPHFVVATFSILPDHDHESVVRRRGNDELPPYPQPQ
jgi:hypothetical protein